MNPSPSPDDPLLSAIRTLHGMPAGQRESVRGWINGVIEEGRKYSRTSAGQRWKRVLAPSDLVPNGWLLWSVAGMDRFLRQDASDAADGSDSNSFVEMLEAICARLAGNGIEEWLSAWSRAGMPVTFRPEEAVVRDRVPSEAPKETGRARKNRVRRKE